MPIPSGAASALKSDSVSKLLFKFKLIALIHEENHFSTFSGRTLSVKEKNDQLAVLVEYVSETFHLHNLYAFKFFFCELVIKPSC